MGIRTTGAWLAAAAMLVAACDKDASGAARPTGPSLETNLSLTALPVVPIDGRLTATLYPGDPGNYVGNLYESDYAFNVRSFTLKTEDEPVEIQLAWPQTGNAALRIWSADETRSASPDGQSIRWPAHTTGLVLVAQMGARLTQPVTFTLTTRKVGG